MAILLVSSKDALAIGLVPGLGFGSPHGTGWHLYRFVFQGTKQDDICARRSSKRTAAFSVFHAPPDDRGKRSSGGSMVIIGIIGLALLLAVGYFLMASDARENARSEAVIDAAQSLGDAAGKVGDAAKDAADKLKDE